MTDEILWQNSCQTQKDSHLFKFMEYIADRYQLEFKRYDDFYQWTINCYELFWQEFLSYSKIKLAQTYNHVLKKDEKFNQNHWFDGAKLNFAQNLLDSEYNLQRLKLQPNYTALMALNENGEVKSYTLRELKQEVAKLANYLSSVGVTKGDRVAGLIPNIAESVIAMLATASLGAVWTACSPDFGTDGILERFEQVEPKVLLVVEDYVYKAKKFSCREKNKVVINKLAKSLDAIIVVKNKIEIENKIVTEKRGAEKSGTQNKSGNENLSQNKNQFLTDYTVNNINVVYWHEIETQSNELKYTTINFNDPIYIMFSSGTTGKPKCIVHGAGGILVEHFKEHLLHHNVTAKDNFFYFTTTSWMMWHWQISALGLGATVMIYDGAPNHPNVYSLIDLIDLHHITLFGASAKYFSGLEKSDKCIMKSNCLSSLRTLFSTGSPLLPEQFDYIYSHFKRSVALCSISGGTDILGCFGLGNPLLPIHRGQLQCRSLGLDVRFFSDEGQELIDQKGELVCLNPFPSMPIYFWNDPDGRKYHQAYFAKFENIWAHGDFGKLTPENGLVIYGRSDAILNPGGVRIGTAEIYSEVEQVAEVVEALAVGQPHDGDERIILFVVLQSDLLLGDELRTKIKQQIKTGASPRHVPAVIIQVPELPKTASGKLVELAVKNIIAGLEVKNKNALANPQCLNYFVNLPELH